MPLALAAFIGQLLPAASWLRENPWITNGAGGIALACSAYACYRLWRVPKTNPDEPSPVRRPVLKGGEKFTENDGELFSRLGRQEELARLWAWIGDDRVALIAVQGESGAGKSSLLEGGLRFLLGPSGFERLENPKPREPIPCVYCEMRPRDPAGELLTAINDTIGKQPEPGPKFASLAEARSGLAQSGRRWVVLLDQFEQVSAREPQHQAIFDFLEGCARQGSRCRLTCVVAFRREYAPEWNRFVARLDAQGLPAPKLLPLELFKVEGPEGGRARDVLATLGQAADLKLDDVADSLIELLASRHREVFPFDLSLSLKCLAGMGTTVPSPRDLPQGGFPALIARYLRSRLADLSPSDREAVFAVIHLKLTRNSAEGRQRVAEGLSLEELAKAGTIAAPDLLAALKRLADRETGLLEEVDTPQGSKHYRLLNERFIPALELLAGAALAGVQQARRVFHDCWGAYSPALPAARLLRGSDLQLVQRHWEQMTDLHADEAKRLFYQRSLRHRSRNRRLTAGASALLLAAALGASWFIDRDLQSQHARDVMKRLVAVVDRNPLREGDFLSAAITERLGELAACNQHARLAALDEVIRRPEFTVKFRGGEGFLIHAVIGLNLEGHANYAAVNLVCSALANHPGDQEDVVVLLKLLRHLRPASTQVQPLASALVSWMTNATAGLDSDALAALGAALVPLATNVTKSALLATLNRIERAMLRGDGEDERDGLTRVWIGLEGIACRELGAERRAVRIVRWLDLPHYATRRDDPDSRRRVRFFLDEESSKDLSVDAQAMLLRHLGALAGRDFHDELWEFFLWARDPKGGGKLGISIPDRPHWWFLRPKPVPFPLTEMEERSR